MKFLTLTEWHYQIEKLNQQAADKETELLALLERAPIQVWNEDLDHFLTGWESYCEEWRNKLNKDSKGRKVKRSQKTLETRKSLPGPGRRQGDDFSDDDFKPTKATAKSKKTEPKPVRAKPGAPSKPVKDNDDDDDLGLPPPPKKRLTSKTMKEESESDVEVVAAPEKASQPKQLRADSDSDVKMVAAPTTKGKGKGRESPKRKRYLFSGIFENYFI